MSSKPKNKVQLVNHKTPFQEFFASILFFELVASGILAFISAISSSRENMLTASAFSSTVNAIASIHYARIWKIRSSETLAVTPDESIQLNEYNVDLLRHSDWFITLPFMIYELHVLAETNVGYETLLFSKEISAFLNYIIIICGGIWRFTFNELRGSSTSFRFIFGICFICTAISFFILTLLNLLYHLNEDMLHFTGIYTLTLIWTGYPLVALLQRLFVNASYLRKYPYFISVFKDISYGLLDLTSKGGLAIYSSLQ